MLNLIYTLAQYYGYVNPHVPAGRDKAVRQKFSLCSKALGG